MSTQRTCFQKQKELFTNTSSGNLLHRANKTQQVLIKVFSSAGQQLLLTNLSTLLLTVWLKMGVLVQGSAFWGSHLP